LTKLAENPFSKGNVSNLASKAQAIALQRKIPRTWRRVVNQEGRFNFQRCTGRLIKTLADFSELFRL